MPDVGAGTMALITKCSGKDRVDYNHRMPVGIHATHRHERRSDDDGSHSSERMLATGESRHNQTIAGDVWFRTMHGQFPAVSVHSRTKICLVSICSLLNASQPQLPTSVAALVDEETPKSVLQGYERLGVRVIDLSLAPFPRYFNNREMSDPAAEQDYAHFRKRTPLPSGATVGDALKLGYPHFSGAVDSWYKLFLWNLTEYERIFYFDPDTLTQHNATNAYLRHHKPFAAQFFPHAGAPQNMQGGMLVLQPSRRDFETLLARWHAGDYPYPEEKMRQHHETCDDDQHFLNHVVIKKRLLSTSLHRFAPCDNDKRGARSHCDPAKTPMYHKWPLWESARIEALWAAAQAGRCTNNQALFNWRPT